MSFESPYPPRPQRPTPPSGNGGYPGQPPANPYGAPHNSTPQGHYPPQPESQPTPYYDEEHGSSGYGTSGAGYGAPQQPQYNNGGQYPQPAYNQPYGGGQYQPPSSGDSNNFAMLGLILAFIFSPAGLVLSILGLRKSKETGEGRGLSLAGIIVSSLSLLGTLIWVIVVAMGVNSAVDDVNKAFEDIEDIPSITETPIPTDPETTAPAEEDEPISPSGLETLEVPSGNETAVTTSAGVVVNVTGVSSWIPTGFTGAFGDPSNSTMILFQSQATAPGISYEDAVANASNWDAFIAPMWGGYQEASGTGAINRTEGPFLDQYGNVYAVTFFDPGTDIPESVCVVKFLKDSDQLLLATIMLYEESGRSAYEEAVAMGASMR